jgi:hypothetical protein
LAESAEIAEAVARAVSDAAEAIVLRAFLRIGEHLVRFVDLLEAVLRRGLVVSDVGVVLARELAIGALDRALVRVASDAENLVVVGGHYRISTPVR